MKIALTKSETKFDVYKSWLEQYYIDYEVLDYKKDSDGLSVLDDCSGLILTGGVDINPEIYCDPDTKENCGTFNPERDTFELKVIEKAMKKRLPILAICRGHQLINIYYKGSLIFDLMETRNVEHERISESENRLHDITVLKDTLLYKIMKTDSAIVTSSHHQAVDQLGEGLMINAKSDDGIIEGIEYSDKKDKPFFLGIQWHPERLENLKDPASENILIYFINECKKISRND